MKARHSIAALLLAGIVLAVLLPTDKDLPDVKVAYNPRHEGWYRCYTHIMPEGYTALRSALEPISGYLVIDEGSYLNDEGDLRYYKTRCDVPVFGGIEIKRGQNLVVLIPYDEDTRWLEKSSGSDRLGNQWVFKGSNYQEFHFTGESLGTAKLEFERLSRSRFWLDVTTSVVRRKQRVKSSLRNLDLLRLEFERFEFDESPEVFEDSILDHLIPEMKMPETLNLRVEVIR